MKNSPLHDIHVSLGAHFREVYGWNMSAHYGNASLEHHTVRKHVGLFDLSYRGKIRIFGKDRVNFLQRILSQDVNRLTPSSGAISTLLDNKGRMLAYMRIYSDQDSFLIDSEPNLSEKIVKILDHYLFREDVRIEDVTYKYALISLQGPLAGKILRDITSVEDIKDMREHDHRNILIDKMSCKVIKSSCTGEEGYDIYASTEEAESLYKLILRKGEDYGLKPAGIDALETLRIEAGIPVYFLDMDEHTIPLEANLEKAISYDKGCYVGQETISRIKFCGHVNKILTGFYVNSDVPPDKGNRIVKFTGKIKKDIGVVTSGCFSPTFNRIIAMGYVKREYNNTGEEVLIEGPEYKCLATVTLLPFYRHEDKNGKPV